MSTKKYHKTGLGERDKESVCIVVDHRPWMLSRARAVVEYSKGTSCLLGHTDLVTAMDSPWEVGGHDGFGETTHFSKSWLIDSDNHKHFINCSSFSVPHSLDNIKLALTRIDVENNVPSRRCQDGSLDPTRSPPSLCTSPVLRSRTCCPGWPRARINPGPIHITRKVASLFCAC